MATVVVVSDLVDLVMEMDGANVKDKLSGAKEPSCASGTATVGPSSATDTVVAT